MAAVPHTMDPELCKDMTAPAGSECTKHFFYVHEQCMCVHAWCACVCVRVRVRVRVRMCVRRSEARR